MEKLRLGKIMVIIVLSGKEVKRLPGICLVISAENAGKRKNDLPNVRCKGIISLYIYMYFADTEVRTFLKQRKKLISFLLALYFAVTAVNIPVVFAEEPEEPVSETVAVEETPAETVVQEQEETEYEEVTMIPSLEELPESDAGYASVPLYFQTDYPNNMFGSGTIANNGCSVTALAMVASYLTGHEYLPDELARYFGGVAENNIERLENGADAMKLPWEKMENFHTTMEALREGKIVIALMESMSLFTDTQHFIVLTGYNEDGLIMVHDPYEPNYEKWNLKRAFREGFTEGDICCGFSGAWAFDKDAMPEDPFLYYEEDLSGDPRYPDIQLTYEERQLLARVIWVEAQGECAEGQQAVAEVVLNRLVSDGFQNTIKGVIYAENQFRSVPFLEDAEPTSIQYEAIERALEGPNVLSENVYYFATYPVNGRIWGKIGGHIFCYE